MSDLTEKWENGELKQGWYFVKLYDRLNIVWLEYTQQDGFFGYYGNHITNYEVEQVLAPVPSYEEWERLKFKVDTYRDYWDLEKDYSNHLKELLKECVEVLNNAQRNYGYDDSILDICSPIITKISELLGEK